jgi:hypothetical protein
MVGTQPLSNYDSYGRATVYYCVSVTKKVPTSVIKTVGDKNYSNDEWALYSAQHMAQTLLYKSRF